ncbi:hypothetical protein NDU88_003436 [Pleurodeles waltl]|uniref:Uncharacterized protein n=1 Tax=Pleurodeles waltl TaxID=8319 RepID=A0AAV7W5K4_PLEWA|nr:hypothetical protein NDU88_003436 [Pleurodeles waltl]
MEETYRPDGRNPADFQLCHPTDDSMPSDDPTDVYIQMLIMNAYPKVLQLGEISEAVVTHPVLAKVKEAYQVSPGKDS